MSYDEFAKQAERLRREKEERRHNMTFKDKAKEILWKLLGWFFKAIIVIALLYECKHVFIKSVDEANEGDYMEHILDKVP